jgi:hypothetical protein
MLLRMNLGRSDTAAPGGECIAGLDGRCDTLLLIFSLLSQGSWGTMVHPVGART